MGQAAPAQMMGAGRQIMVVGRAQQVAVGMMGMGRGTPAGGMPVGGMMVMGNMGAQPNGQTGYTIQIGAGGQTPQQPGSGHQGSGYTQGSNSQGSGSKTWRRSLVLGNLPVGRTNLIGKHDTYSSYGTNVDIFARSSSYMHYRRLIRNTDRCSQRDALTGPQ